MCPTIHFHQHTHTTVWSCLITILPLLINELVLAMLYYHLFLFVDFLNQHLQGRYILQGSGTLCSACFLLLTIGGCAGT